MDGTLVACGNNASSGNWKAMGMVTRGLILPCRARISLPRSFAMSPVMPLPESRPQITLQTRSRPGTGTRKVMPGLGSQELGLCRH